MALSRAELREQQKRLEQKAEEEKRQLAAQLQQSFDEDVAALCQSIQELAEEAGMHAQVLVEQRILPALSGKPKRMPVAKEAKTAKAPKYRNPATGETWVGTGQPPKWITFHEKAGNSRADFLIENQHNGVMHA